MIQIIILGLLAIGIAKIIPIGSIIIAIIIGVLLGNSRFGDKVTKSAGQSEKYFLAWAIIFLGSEIQLKYLKNLGIKTIIFIFLIFIITITIGYFVARLFKCSKQLSALLGIGNAVCGSAAIIATSPILKSKNEDIAISIGIINLMGSVAVFIIPAVLTSLHASNIISGLLIGGTFQAVGQTVAAGFMMGAAVGKLALLIKMGRVILLIPLMIALSLKQKNKKTKFPIPLFVIGFFVVVFITSIPGFPTQAISAIKTIGDILLAIAMVAIGAKINIKTLKKTGLNLIVVELSIFAFQIFIAILLIYFLKI